MSAPAPPRDSPEYQSWTTAYYINSMQSDRERIAALQAQQAWNAQQAAIDREERAARFEAWWRTATPEQRRTAVRKSLVIPGVFMAIITYFILYIGIYEPLFQR